MIDCSNSSPLLNILLLHVLASIADDADLVVRHDHRNIKSVSLWYICLMSRTGSTCIIPVSYLCWNGGGGGGVGGGGAGGAGGGVPHAGVGVGGGGMPGGGGGGPGAQAHPGGPPPAHARAADVGGEAAAAAAAAANVPLPGGLLAQQARLHRGLQLGLNRGTGWLKRDFVGLFLFSLFLGSY